MNSERTQLAAKIFDVSRLTGHFILRSGVEANTYFDKYQFESDPDLLHSIATAMLDIVPAEFDVLAGLELGGVPLAVMLAQLTGKPALFVRKKAKTYGTCRLAEGTTFANKRVLVVEDVVTSGGQVVLSSQDLRERGAVITDAICVIDRQAGGYEKLAQIGVKLHPLFTRTELESAGTT